VPLLAASQAHFTACPGNECAAELVPGALCVSAIPDRASQVSVPLPRKLRAFEAREADREHPVASESESAAVAEAARVA
jgi:hypothetical protein